MRMHMVAIGGSVMHNLALDLAATGHVITGSDDEFYEPSRSRLASAGMLPEYTGWFPDRITPEIDCVIAGMHAKADNPEIRRAAELDIRIYSFPEFFGEHCRYKKRLVIAGSHGKTTTTAMIMHAMRAAGLTFDYLIGAAVDGFERNVRLSDAPIVVIEGDEYPSSPLDPSPKIMHYDPDVAIITGVAWDHMNVFPTWDSYIRVFRDFIASLKADVCLIWHSGDEILSRLVRDHGTHVRTVPYTAMETAVVPAIHESTVLHPPSGQQASGTWVYDNNRVPYELRIFGSHNLQNLSAAALVCGEVGISMQQFLGAMRDFPGAAMRLEMVFEAENLVVYRDFAHAPSKVKATVDAIRERYRDRYVVACFELHTYSSLNAVFLPQYKGTLDNADHALIFYSPGTLEIKRMPMISPADILGAFSHHALEVITGIQTLRERLAFISRSREKTVLLLMSSGRFGQMDLLSIFSDQAPHII